MDCKLEATSNTSFMFVKVQICIHIRCPLSSVTALVFMSPAPLALHLVTRLMQRRHHFCRFVQCSQREKALVCLKSKNYFLRDKIWSYNNISLKALWHHGSRVVPAWWNRYPDFVAVSVELSQMSLKSLVGPVQTAWTEQPVDCWRDSLDHSNSRFVPLNCLGVGCCPDCNRTTPRTM